MNGVRFVKIGETNDGGEHLWKGVGLGKFGAGRSVEIGETSAGGDYHWKSMDLEKSGAGRSHKKES
ncbi:hypothetical protein U1Q18_017372, partial [Sarracenia purpurea var. burkii]